MSNFVQNKKLKRLFDCKNIPEADFRKINELYEKRQTHVFFKAVVFPAFTALFLGSLFFKDLNRLKNTSLMAVVFVSMHFTFKRNIELQFVDEIDPFFKIYKIK